MLRCRVFGHRLRFSSDGATMHWHCERSCGVRGSKTYDSPAAARCYARAFDREDRDDIGRRGPLVGLFPLRLRRALSRRADRR